MAFDDFNKKVKASNGLIPTAPSNSGGFNAFNKSVLDTNINLTPEQSAKMGQANKAAIDTQAESAQANSFGSFAKAATITPVKAIVNTGIDYARSLWNTYSQTPNKLAEDIKSSAATLDQADTAGQILKGFTKAAIRTSGDAAIAVFAPVSDAIGIALNKLGGQHLVDEAGKVIADKSGITDLKAFQDFALSHPNAGEDFNRLVTLFLAKGEKGQIDPAGIYKEASGVVDRFIGDAKPPENSVAAKEPIRLPVESQSVENKVPIETPKTRLADYSKAQGYEPIVPDNQLPTIDAGKLPKGDLPIIQMETPTPTRYGSLRYEPIPATPVPDAATKAFETFNSSVAKENPTTVVEAVKPIETIPPPAESVTKTSGLSDTLKRDAIAKGVEGDLGESPLYDTRPRKFQEAADFVLKDPEEAFKVARGEASAPQGLLHSEIYSALKRKAILEGDAAMIKRLGTDVKITSIAREAGQLVQGYDAGFANDPVQAIKEIQEARIKGANTRSGSIIKKGNVEASKENLLKKGLEETKKVVSKKETWAEVVRRLQC